MYAKYLKVGRFEKLRGVTRVVWSTWHPVWDLGHPPIGHSKIGTFNAKREITS
jgi:hypothetical protein